MTGTAEIAALKARLDALRPLTSASLDALEVWYDVELTYTSNAVEGNTLTRSETALVLEKGITVRGKPLRDHMEAIDHREALGYVRRLAARDEPLREGDVRDLHALVLARSQPGEAGRYSAHQRAVAGSTVAFPSPAGIGPLMAAFGEWLSAAPPAFETAFEAHYRLVTIHPFSDGNGRTARLLMNLCLLRGGYPPVVVGPEERADYLDALEARQTGRDAAPYAALMTDRLLASLRHHIEHAERALA